MSSREIGNIIIEGSSTAQGWGDEAEKVGYAGRLLYHYLKYNNAARDEPTLPWVDVHMNVQRDRYLPNYTRGLSDRLGAINMDSAWMAAVKNVGIFAVGSYRARMLREGSREEIPQKWRQALESLERTCDQASVTPILLGTPVIARGVILGDGKPPDTELLERLADMTARLTASWATSITFEDIVGRNKPHYMSADGMHPNALGYDAITAHLIPLINREFGIPESYDQLVS